MVESVHIDFAEIFRGPFETRSFKTGEAVFSEGEAGDFMYVILAGEVEIKVKGKYVDTIGTGGIIGEMALLDNSPRSATAMALEACEVVAVDQAQFQNLIRETPSFAINVMRVMADRLRGMNMML